MNRSSIIRGRPAREKLSIIEFYRRQIVSGQLAPGSRLPSRAMLEVQHKISLPTVQRAMAQLEAAGWIESRGRHGTFVARRLPHQSRYALVLPFRPGDVPNFSLFYQALIAAAKVLERQSECEFEIVHADRAVLGVADENRVLDEVRTHRLAGLIFVGYPAQLQATRLFKEPKLYLTAITYTGEYLGVPATSMSSRSWFAAALDCAVAAGRLRVASLSIWPKSSVLTHAFRSALVARGLEPRTYWQQHADPQSAEWAAELAQVLLALPAGDRPDALLITDDNFVEPVTAGLRAAGIRVPADLLVIAHFNHPVRPKARVPVRWLGYDCIALLRRGRSVIDAQRRGDSVGTQTVMPAVWDTDLKPAARTRTQPRTQLAPA